MEKRWGEMMDVNWDVDMSGTGKVSGWGDDNFDMGMEGSDDKNMKDKKSKKKRKQHPLSPTGDPTAMLIKYAERKNSTEYNGKSSPHLRRQSGASHAGSTTGLPIRRDRLSAGAR